MNDSKNEKSNFNIAIPMICASTLLIIATFWADAPHGFYQLLRLVVFASCAINVWDCYKKRRHGWLWTLCFAGILFNPFLPISFEEDTWRWIDALAAGVVIFYIIKCQRQYLAEIKETLIIISKKESVRITGIVVGVIVALIVFLLLVMAGINFVNEARSARIKKAAEEKISAENDKINAQLTKVAEENAKFIDVESKVFSDGKVILQLHNKGKKKVRNIHATLVVEPPKIAADISKTSSESQVSAPAIYKLEKLKEELKVGAEYRVFETTMATTKSIDGCSSESFKWDVHVPEGAKYYTAYVTQADFSEDLSSDSELVGVVPEKCPEPRSKPSQEPQSNTVPEKWKAITEYKDQNVEVRFVEAKVHGKGLKKSLSFSFIVKIVNKTKLFYFGFGDKWARVKDNFGNDFGGSDCTPGRLNEHSKRLRFGDEENVTFCTYDESPVEGTEYFQVEWSSDLFERNGWDLKKTVKFIIPATSLDDKK